MKPLLQEKLMAEDPTGWRMLVGCILLNQTSRKQVDEVVPTLFEFFPSPRSFEECGEDDVTRDMLIEVLTPLGLQRRRAVTLEDLGAWWERHKSSNTNIDEHVVDMDPPGVGEYARDSWIIFKMGPTDEGMAEAFRCSHADPKWPKDKELWKWWSPIWEAAELEPHARHSEDRIREGWQRQLRRGILPEVLH